MTLVNFKLILLVIKTTTVVKPIAIFLVICISFTWFGFSSLRNDIYWMNGIQNWNDLLRINLHLQFSHKWECLFVQRACLSVSTNNWKPKVIQMRNFILILLYMLPKASFGVISNFSWFRRKQATRQTASSIMRTRKWQQGECYRICPVRHKIRFPISQLFTFNE